VFQNFGVRFCPLFFCLLNVFSKTLNSFFPFFQGIINSSATQTNKQKEREKREREDPPGVLLAVCRCSTFFGDNTTRASWSRCLLLLLDFLFFWDDAHRRRERERTHKREKKFGKISFALKTLFPFYQCQRAFFFAADADRRHIYRQTVFIFFF